MPFVPLPGPGRTVGRYALFEEIASGGMATVHLGRLVGPVGFSRTVAIKRLHAHLAKDPDFVAMFLDEARLVARIRHPNVVPTLDVVQEGSDLLLVMEYVQGESLAKLIRRCRARDERVPVPIVASVLVGVLHGLHAAHEASGENGEPLAIVHRDVSPQNILVGTDGVARLLDFGVAKAEQRSQSTRDGQVKGKIAYMAPEQISSDHVDRRCDIFAMGALLWEALTGQRLFEGPSDARVIQKILTMVIPPPSQVATTVSPKFDAICARALARNPGSRFDSARDMALAIEKASPLATASEVGAWVEMLAHEAIAARAARVKDVESRSDVFARAPSSSEALTEPVLRGAAASSGELEGDEIEITIAETPVPPAPTRRARWLVVAAAVVLLGAAAMAGFALATSSKGVPAPPVAAVPDTPAPALPPVAAAPAATEEATAVAPIESAPQPAPTPAPRPEPRRGVVRPVAAPPAAKAHTADCSQPFSIDSSGIKHVKPECL
jgi:hypothetical protein